MRKAVVTVMAIFAMVASLLTPSVITTSPAEAANSSLFNPGNIISNAVFFDGAAMDTGTVQNFLNSKVPSCRSGYTCMKNYSQATPSLSRDSYCGAYSGSASESAAAIISKVGQSCGISPKVLLVLLEKEQSLVSDTWPLDSQYRNATGFACPDTAPCDPSYNGFFYQVYYAARQFQKYAATPNSWNYKAGQYNNIRYHPNAACGSSSVYIQNQATAGLYIYTPYQPNSAALSNLYGTGDSCSAYGNRNFWRMFTDWFGSTTGSTLMRSPENATVFLVTSAGKYPIGTWEIVGVYSPLGEISYVSQTYLDSLPTQQLASRIARGPDGSIYYLDSGIKLPFSSCALVSDWGGACAASGYVQLDDAQVASFQTGPLMGSVVGTTSGIKYFVNDGTRSEVLDTASLAAAGISGGTYNVLSDNAVLRLSPTAPIVRDLVFVSERGSARTSFLANGLRYPITSEDSSGMGVSQAGVLSREALELLPQSTETFKGAIVASGSSTPVSVLSQGGRITLSATAPTSLQTPVSVPQAFIDSFRNDGEITLGSFLKAPDNGSIYIVMQTDIRPISSWGTLLFITDSPSWMTVGRNVIFDLAWGPVALTGGNLYRTADEGTVYLINGLSGRIAFSVFDFPFEAGFSEFAFTSNERLNAYPMSTPNLTYGLKCGTTNYITSGGQAHLLSPGMESLYPAPFTFVDLDTYTCRKLKIGMPASHFIRTPDGTIYKLDSGNKLPISSLTRFNQISNGEGFMNVSQRFANLLPTGPLA